MTFNIKSVVIIKTQHSLNEVDIVLTISSLLASQSFSCDWKSYSFSNTKLLGN